MDTYIDAQAQGHMHKFTYSTHMGTRKHSLKVSTVKPILSVFLCALFPTVLVFFTPRVTMCHHLPSQRWSQCYLQTVLRKIQGQKGALGVCSVEQKYGAHMMFDIFIHFCVAQRYITMHGKDNHFVLNYRLGANVALLFS